MYLTQVSLYCFCVAIKVVCIVLREYYVIIAVEKLERFTATICTTHVVLQRIVHIVLLQGRCDVGQLVSP